jgi:integrase/recombinase XerC
MNTGSLQPAPPVPSQILAAKGVPVLLAPTEAAATRSLEFFAVTIRNPHTRRAYAHAVSEFSDWCQAHSVTDISEVRPMHVAAYIAPRVRIVVASIELQQWGR